MKRILHALFILASSLALGIAIHFFIQTRSESRSATAPLANRIITVDSAAEVPEQRVRSPESGFTSRIPVRPQETILELLDINLDGDDGEEQVLLIRDPGEEAETIRLVVVDYLPQRGIWSRVWEIPVPVVNIPTVSVRVLDLTGDRVPSVLVTGLDAENRQVLQAFRIAPRREGLDIRTIASFRADSITILSSERSEAYQLGSSPDPSWPIVTSDRDPESGNPLDRVESFHDWDRRNSEYLLVSETRIPGSRAGRLALEQLLSGPVGDRDLHLRGIWSRVAPGRTKSEVEDPRSVYVDTGSGVMTFMQDGGIEVFRIVASSPTRYGVYLVAENEAYTGMKRRIGIDISGMDTIDLRIEDERSLRTFVDSGYSGRYSRMPGPVAGARTAAAGDPESPDELPDLDGLWLSSDGGSLEFRGNRFTRTEGDGTKEGFFSVYRQKESLVLDLRTVDAGGVPSARSVYGLSLARYDNGRESWRTARLVPSVATRSGIEPGGRPAVVYTGPGVTARIAAAPVAKSP